MARYIIEEMPDLQKTGKRITYPKFARIDNTSIKELAQRVGDVSGFSAGDIEGVLLQTAIEMAHLMAEGRSVKIDGIGTFTPHKSYPYPSRCSFPEPLPQDVLHNHQRNYRATEKFYLHTKTSYKYLPASCDE